MSSTELIETDPTTNPVVISSENIKNCENCHQPLNGPFCANCGQSTDSTLKYFWVVILHLLDDIFSFDSRALRTVWPLITRPAFLTNEYFAGRRVHYVPPLRLYLFISIVFFLTLKFFLAVDDGKIINVNDKQSLITQVKSHIKALEVKKSALQKKALDIELVDKIGESTKNLTQLNEELIRFNSYLADLNLDYDKFKNKKIIKLTRQIVELEFDKAGATLPPDEQKEFDKLVTSRLELHNGIEGIAEELTISNNEDGSLSFDFLSKAHNKKLNELSKELTEKAEKAFNSDTAPLIEEIISKLPQLMFILLPLFAVLLKVMFIFSKRLYMEHLTVALHSHSFIFIASLLFEMLDLLEGYLEKSSPSLASFFGVVASGLLIWIPIYLFLMQKRVYKQGKFFTFVKFSIIGTIYSMMIVVTGLIAMVWGIMGS